MPVTEAEWKACTDPGPMLEFLRGKASDRKLLLFACGCCHRLWHLLLDERSRLAVKVTERFADGTATSQDQEQAFQANWDFNEGMEGDSGLAAIAAHSAACSRLKTPPQFEIHPLENANSASRWAAHAVASPKADRISVDDEFHDLVPWVSERTAQAALLRCIIGPLPFRPVLLPSALLSSNLIALTQGIYADRRFEAIPVLADALEEAGCYDAEIMNHCRELRPHSRGCWVVDLLLAKE